MKRPIPWHEQCLANQKNSLSRKIRELQGVQSEVNRMQSEIAFYESQIESARKLGKCGFDEDRFMRKIPKKEAPHALK